MQSGVHMGPQDLDMDELKRIWPRADEAGIAAYMEVGADGLNIAFHPPID
jgi:hypothetical protein